ncbi:hypothetical protein LWI28_017729 [Acer negundo]|uniref:DCD domain-containing protein n=1 Tax=Acer negundo TaxID=4023 RepID=A0AAD5JTB8_ACENE|nr:hypothetical protein LWI28_017729 [Acer negundo]
MSTFNTTTTTMATTTTTTDHDNHLTWRNVAAMLTSNSDNQSMRNYKCYYMGSAENDEYCCKRSSYSSFGTSTALMRSLSLMKMQHINDQTTDQKWYKTLPPGEMLPRNEVLGGYIFVCNNETMQEDLHRQLFGLPQKYKDYVRAITPGLPLFLYNYTSHQLHGVFQAVSFGRSNIDPTAWEDKKCKGESRFPAQVRVGIKKKCKPLEEDAFRPVLYHYDGPKFRLQLSVPEAIALLDLFKEEDRPLK